MLSLRAQISFPEIAVSCVGQHTRFCTELRSVFHVCQYLPDRRLPYIRGHVSWCHKYFKSLTFLHHTCFYLWNCGKWPQSPVIGLWLHSKVKSANFTFSLVVFECSVLGTREICQVDWSLKYLWSIFFSPACVLCSARQNRQFSSNSTCKSPWKQMKACKASLSMKRNLCEIDTCTWRENKLLGCLVCGKRFQYIFTYILDWK